MVGRLQVIYLPDIECDHGGVVEVPLDALASLTQGERETDECDRDP